VKLSISLPNEDVEALDRYAKTAGISSRSAAIRRAIHLLGNSELEEAYAAAWEEWETSGDAAAWDHTAGDGVADASR
jgi:Arc/MetJ-type ribon-helix-helix transcriptional regulator